MLVLRRKIGEVLVLSGGVEIEVIGIARSRVKLGIRAPKDVAVQRKESLGVAHENVQAAQLMKVETNGELLSADLLQTILQKAAKTNKTAADM